MTRSENKPKKIGLALGGGGAKGLAHIGVIKALRNAAIPIDFIAGTSMGAIVGGWYAATEDINFIEDFFLKLKLRDILPVGEVFKKRDGALFRGESVEKLLGAHFKNMRIEDCGIPFTAIATDIKNGDEVVLKNGKLADAVRASAALPIVFHPVKIGEKMLFDGGMSDPVPADAVREMGAEYVIAVDVSSKWLGSPEEMADTTKSVYAAISNSMGIVEYQLARQALKQADIILRPPVLNFNFLGFGAAEEIIQFGKEEANLHIREIRKNAGYKEPPKTLGEKFLDFLFHLDEG